MTNIGANERYEAWRASPAIDADTRAELNALDDKAEISDRFYRDLSFGTGGIRGIMGAGTNRMNRYTVKKAVWGLGKQLSADPALAEKGVVIACDTRMHSQAFSRLASDTLRTFNIPTRRFAFPVPTPVLSFATVKTGAAAGIMITASHNPKAYNGLKVYGPDGVQLTPGKADALTSVINEIPDPLNVPKPDPKGTETLLGEEMLSCFVDAVLSQSRWAGDKSNLSIVYTPIHGAALKPVTETLRRDGFPNVQLVPEQLSTDGTFPTVKSPNPEERGALRLGLELAKKGNADLVLGTDPDGDRLGVGVLDHGEYRLLTGNQIGALLTYFVLSETKGVTERDTLIKTVVTGELGARIAADYGVRVVNTLTGFKYIGEEAVRMEQDGDGRFLMGYEESYGYLVGMHARDKDASVAAMLICELAAMEKAEGRTLFDRLMLLYQTYGFYLDTLVTVLKPGERGASEIDSAMAALRENGGRAIPEPNEMLDYLSGIGSLPKENVLKFVFHDGSWLAARPSGTEPKIKFYYSIHGENEQEASMRLTSLKAAVLRSAGL